MRSLLLSLLLLLATLAPALPAVTTPPAGEYQVLVLHSYHPGYRWTDDISRAIEAVLRPGQADSSTRLEYVYMDTKRIDDPAYLHRLYELLLVRFDQRPRLPDAILAVDNDALEFLRQYGTRLFGRVPVVFCGINDLRADMIPDRASYTGVAESFSAEETLQLALKLQPAVERVLVIGDRTTTGLALARQLGATQLGGGVPLEFAEDLPLPLLEERVRALGPNTLIFYTVFNRDRLGTYYEDVEALARLAAVSPVPIYGAWDFQLGHGIVGGKLVSAHYQGELAARMVQRVLAGELPAEIPVVPEGANLYMFDYLQLERYGIDRDAIPAASVLINTPEHRYRRWLLLGGGAMLLLVTAILLLLYNIHRRKLAEVQLLEAQTTLEHKVQERTRQLRTANIQLRWENQERRKAEEEIRKLAFYDSLTDLPNRTLFRDRLEQALGQAERQGHQVALLFFDLDDFKRVNDSLGHSVGDALLQLVAKRVRGLLRKSDTLARLGGDEFVVILSRVQARRAADIVAGKIVEGMRQPIQVDEHQLVTTTSVGIAIYPRDGRDGETLLRCADMAMYAAKRAGRSEFRRFDPEMLKVVLAETPPSAEG